MKGAAWTAAGLLVLAAWAGAGDGTARGRGEQPRVAALIRGDRPRPLVRWADSFDVVLEGRLASEPRMRPRLLPALARIGRLTGLRLTIADRGACVLAVGGRLSDPRSVAETTLYVRGAVIRRASVRFRTLDDALDERVLLHEMGHVLGLHHSTDGRDVMAPMASRAEAAWYRPAELRALSLMYARRPLVSDHRDEVD